MGWFDEARLGLFVHWDHASQQGIEISWPLVGGLGLVPGGGQAVSVQQYHSTAATFDPTEWDPAAFAKTAKQTGAAYVVFTAKHHSGYCMFDSALTDFSVTRTSPYGRDIVGELIPALRNEGLRVGIYYSLSDWHHPDYPAFEEGHKPYLFGLSPPMPAPERWDRYRRYLMGQLTELLANYGTIDLLWFDGQWERAAAAWGVPELVDHIRAINPDIVINDRLPGGGDYETPEQFIPAQPPANRWETCMTMNETWAYNPHDHRYKSPRALVHALCEVAGRGGNLLLNVSPTGTGALPSEQTERLAVVGEWMATHAEAVRGTTAGLEPWQFYGPTTRRDGRVYLHLLSRPYESVTVRGVPVKRVEKVSVVGGAERALRYRPRTTILDSINADPSGELTIEVPEDVLDPYVTVVAIDFAPAPIR